jgi:hypothetical protein
MKQTLILTALLLAPLVRTVGAQTKAPTTPDLNLIASHARVAENEIKPAPSGLVCFGFPPRGWESVFNYIIQKIKWEELEPEPGQYEAGFRKLDEMLQRAGDKGLSVHLLVVCGADSPAWLKKQVGTVTVFDPGGLAYNPNAKGGRTCARWWETEFGKAYSRMQQALANRYDSHPRLAAVGMNRCMSFWPEPFMRQLRDAQNRRNLREAGYSAALDKTAQSETLQTHARCWKRTCSSIALNPYQELADADSWRPNMEYTAAFIREAVGVLGKRLVLQNDSFVYECSQLGDDYWKMYDLMKGSGAVFGLQPRGTTQATIGDTRKLIEAAIRQGAGYLELVNIYEKSGVPKEDFAAFDKQLEANAARCGR